MDFKKFGYGVKKFKKDFYLIPLCILAIPLVLLIRLIKPLILFRFSHLFSTRIGHFAANTELMLCEQDAGISPLPNQKHIDVFFILNEPVCNNQLAKMWGRILFIAPHWLIRPIKYINKIIPGGTSHVVPTSMQNDRDIYHLLDQTEPHLQFTREEILRGQLGLRELGIPDGKPFICLNVRDNTYLDTQFKGVDFSYHNFRDCEISNFVLVAETMAELGFYVLRMGAIVKSPLKSSHPKVIDYATSGKRTDFMDIFLGANCTFAISTSTGWDSIPYVFRRPICFVNAIPIAYFMTYRRGDLVIGKKLIKRIDKKVLNIEQIFSYGLGFAADSKEYLRMGIEVTENTPEEICQAAIEMVGRINGTWTDSEYDLFLQKKFWEKFPKKLVDPTMGRPFHTEIYSKIGSHFLKNNLEWFL